jgi:hypothetical protein
MMIKLLMASVFCIVPFIAMAAAAGSELFLSGEDVDLLVGTPAGVSEPLDSRRTILAEEDRIDYSNMLEEDFSDCSGFAIQEWHDAEEIMPDETLTESQYLDLVSETNELEELSNESNAVAEYFEENASDTSEENDENIQEQIETEQEL